MLQVICPSQCWVTGVFILCALYQKRHYFVVITNSGGKGVWRRMRFVPRSKSPLQQRVHRFCGVSLVKILRIAALVMPVTDVVTTGINPVETFKNPRDVAVARLTQGSPLLIRVRRFRAHFAHGCTSCVREAPLCAKLACFVASGTGFVAKIPR